MPARAAWSSKLNNNGPALAGERQLSRAAVGRKTWRLRRAAQAVEQREENYGNSGADQRDDQQVNGEKWRGAIEQESFGEGQHGLVHVEQHEDQGEAAERVFRIDASADGRGDEADNGFRDAARAFSLPAAQISERRESKSFPHGSTAGAPD